MFTGRVLSSITIAVITSSTCAFVSSFQIPKPTSVLVPVPYDLLEGIQWTSDPGLAETTCGTFKAYRYKSVEKIAGRWYTVYMSNFTKKTDYCSQFSNVQQPCRCVGIDFTTNLKDEVVSFDMFSTNINEKSVTYEMATAQMNGKTQLNLYQIVLRIFVMQSNARMWGKGGYVIPSGVLVDTDEFNTYMILLFCLEKAEKPIVMVLSNTVPPMSNTSLYNAMSYLSNNSIDVQLLQVDHSDCRYGQNLVGYSGK